VIDQFLQSATLFDVVIGLLALGMFVVGWLQGTIRQLLGIGVLLVAFVFAGGLREPLGNFLAENWTFNDRLFNLMLAMLAVWVAASVTLIIGVQSFYRRVVIHRRLVVLDEILGGLLGAAQVLIVFAMLTIIFDSYYATLAPGATAHDSGWARTIWQLLKDSAVVHALRDGFIPAMVAILSPLLPADVSAPSR
jgi:uncharacterized membrane protein required for colicin V production